MSKKSPPNPIKLKLSRVQEGKKEGLLQSKWLDKTQPEDQVTPVGFTEPDSPNNRADGVLLAQASTEHWVVSDAGGYVRSGDSSPIHYRGYFREVVSDAGQAGQDTFYQGLLRTRSDAVAEAATENSIKTGFLIAGLAAVGLAMAGGGDSGVAPASTVRTAQLVDSPVSGVDVYQGGVKIDTTDAQGQFDYDTSKGAVTFKVGLVTVGSITSVPTDGLVLPQDIAGVARTDTSGALVQVIARFLQSLDADGDLTNGIATDATKLDVASPTSLSASTDLTTVFAAGVSIVSVQAALAHLPTSVTPTNLYRVAFAKTADSNTASNAVAEGSAVGTAVGVTASAADADVNGNTVTYSLVANVQGAAYTAGQYQINATSGVVTTQRALTTETDGTTVTIYVKATSADGSSAIQSFNIAISDTTADASATMTVTVAAGDEVTNAAEKTSVSIALAHVDADATGVAVVFSDANAGTADVTKNATWDEGTSSWKVTDADLSTLSDGTITVMATVTDDAGNTATATDTLDLDTTADASPAMTVTVAAGDEVTNAAEKTSVSVALAHVDADATGVAVVFSDANAGTADVTKNATWDEGTSSWKVTDADLSTLSDGTITVMATVTDDAGNTATATDTLTLDTMVPTIVSQTTVYSQADDTIPDGVVLKFSETLGVVPDTSVLGVTINGNARAVTAVSVSGDELTVLFANSIAGAVAVTYTPSASQNNITDLAGNDAAGFDPGLVADGLMRNAQVWIDVNGNGQVDGDDANADGVIDPTEPSTDFFVGLTDAQGNFFVPGNAPKGAILALGGYNIDTGVPNNMTIKAPEGALVVNPLTTLVQEMFEQQLAAGNAADAVTLVEQAAAAVAASLGFASDIDLTSYDPIASGNVEGQKAAAQIATTVSLAAGADPGNASTVMANLASVFQNAGSGVVDLADANVVSSALSNTANLTTDVISAVSDASSAIGSASNLDSISRAQSSALDRVAPAAPQLSTAASLTNDTTPTVRVTINTADTTGQAVVAGDVIRFFDSDLPLGLPRTVIEADIKLGYLDIALPPLAEGLHAISVSVADLAGNVSETAQTLSIRVDTTAPSSATLNRVATDDIIGISETASTLSGQAEAGSQVLLTLGTQTRTLRADSNGDWSFALQAADLAALEQGSSTVTVLARDAAGNDSALTQRSIAVDTQAPTVTGSLVRLLDNVELGVDDITVSGVSTNDNTLGLVGTLSATLGQGDTLVVFDTVAGQTTRLGLADLGGENWTFLTPSLSNGAHAFSVRVQDAAGNLGPSGASFAVTVDASVPDTLVTVFSGAAVTGQVLPQITGTLSKPLATGEKVVIFDRGVQIAEIEAEQINELNWSFQPGVDLSPGSHEITAAVQGEGGNQGQRSTIPYNFVVDTQGPTVSIAPTVDTDTGVMANIASGGATRDNTLTLKGFVADASGIGAVQILDGDALLGTANPTSSGAWSYTTSALIDGLHSLSVRAVDLVGNAATTLPVLVTVDTTAPQAPDLATFATDNKLNAAELAATLTVLNSNDKSQALKIEGTSDEANVRILLTLNAATGVKRSVMADGNGNWSYTLTSDDYVALGQGLRSVLVSAMDAVGNAGAAATLALEVDTKAPALTAFTLADSSDTGVKGDGRSNLAQPTIQFVAEAGASLLVNWDKATAPNSFVALGVADGTLTSLSAPTAYTTSGPKTIVVRAVDAAGNFTDRTGSFDLDITAPLAPTLGLALDAANGVNVSANGASAAVARVGAVNVTGERGAQVSVSFSDAGKVINKTFVGTGVAQTVALSLDEIKTLGDGIVTVVASQTDAAGNAQTEAASTVSFKLDTSVAVTDASLGASAIAPLNAAGVPIVTSAAISAPTANTIETGAGVEYRVGSVAVDASVSFGAWSTTYVAPSTDGEYRVQVRQIDLAGNTSAPQTLAFVRDTSAPDVSAAIQSVLDDVGLTTGSLTLNPTPVTDDNTPQLTGLVTGTLGAGERVVVYDTFASTLSRLGVATVTNSQWSFTPKGLENGVHRFSVRVEDAVGNHGNSSAEMPVEVNTNRPAAIPTVDAAPAYVKTTTPTITGSLSATLSLGEVLQVFDSGRLLGQANVTDTTWSFTPTAGSLGSGAIVITAAVKAASGVLGGASNAYVLTLDTVLPTVTFDSTVGTDSGSAATVTYTAPKTALTRDNTLALRGTVLDASGIQQVEVFDGSNSLGIAALQSGTWTLTTPALSAGLHALTAIATDVAGNSKTSTQVLVEVDVQAPSSTSLSVVATDDKINASEVAAGNLQLSGTAEENARVLINLGTSTSAQRTVTADVVGNWSYAVRKEDLSAWGQGMRTLNFTVSDAAGNLSTAVSKTILIDTLTPTLTQVSLADASDSGVKGDARTSVTTPTLQFTAEAGSTIAVDWKGTGSFVGNTVATGQVQSVTAPAGTFVIDGSNNVTVRVTDSAGNTSLRVLPLTVDSSAPNAPTLSLGAGVGTGGASETKALGGVISVSGEVGADVLVSLTRGVVTVSKTLTGTGTATPIALTKEDVSLLGDGTISVSAVQKDAAGNMSATPATSSFILDTFAAAPNASLTGLSSLGLTNQTALTPATNIESGAVVEYRLNAVAENGAVTQGIWTRGYIAPTTSGTYQLQLRQTDLAGNESTLETLNFTLDLTPPQAVASITAADDDVGTPNTGLVSGATTDDNTPTLRGTVTGTVGNSDVVVVYDIVGGSPVRLGSSAIVQGAWSLTVSGLTKGLHSFRAVVQDPAGNTSVPSSDFALNIDADPPATTVTLSGGTAAAPRLTNLSSAVSVEGVLSAELKTGETVRVFQDGVLTALAVTATPGQNTVSFKVPSNLAAGDYRWSMAVQSSTGLLGATSEPVVLRVDQLGPTLGPMTVIADQGLKANLASGDSTRDNTLSLSGTVKDTNGVAKVEIFNGISKLGDAQLSATGAWSYTTAPLAQGSYAFTAQATDLAGNSTSSSSEFITQVITAKPVAPQFGVFAGDNKINIAELSSVLSGTGLLLKGTAPANALITIGLPNGATRTVVADSAGVWELPLNATEIAALGQGSATITARAADAVGNVSDAASLVVLVDTLAPTRAAITQLTLDRGVAGYLLTNDTTPELTIKAEVGATFKLFKAPATAGDAPIEITSGFSIAAVADSAGTYRLTVSSDLSDGNYGILVLDGAGNSGPTPSASTSDGFRIDHTAPTITTGNLSVAENQPMQWALLASEMVTWSLVSGANAGVFNLNNGNLSLKAPLNFEDLALAGPLSVQILAVDLAGNETTKTLGLTVTDVNEAPTALSLSATTASLAENTPTTNRVELAALNLTDDALGINTISVSDPTNFEVLNGKLYLKANTVLNYEGKSNYAVKVAVADNSVVGSTPVTANFNLAVSDLNEAPTVVSLSATTASLAENTPTTNRMELASINLTDDALGTNTVSVSDPTNFEVLNGKLYLKANTVLNYEVKSSYAVAVTVADNSLVGSTPVTANFNLTLSDLNEAPTALSLSATTASLAENTPTTNRVELATLNLTDDALGTNTISVSDPTNFEVLNGKLYLKANTVLNYEGKSSYGVTVSVGDAAVAGSTPVTTNFNVAVSDVNEAPTAVGTSVLRYLALDRPDQNVDVAALFNDPDAGDTLTYAVTSGTLPNGLALDGGAIAGKPTAVGQSNVTITGTDKGGLTVSKSISLNVVNGVAIGGLSITDAVGPSSTVGKAGEAVSLALTFTESVTIEGTPTLTFRVGEAGPTFTAQLSSSSMAQSVFTVAAVLPAGTSSVNNGEISLIGVNLGGGAIQGTIFSLDPSLQKTVKASGYQVDNEAPAAAVITAIDEDKGQIGDGLISDTTPVLSLSAEANASFKLFKAPESQGASPIEITTGFTVQPDEVSGAYTLTLSQALGDGDYGVVVVDAAGNVGPVPSGSGTDTFRVDATLPTITTGDQSVAENQSAQWTLQASEAVTWSLVADGDAGLFNLASGVLSLKNPLNFEAVTYPLSIQVKATDAAGNEAVKTLNVTLTDVNEVPRLIGTAPSLTVNEADQTPTTLPALNLVTGRVQDVDAGDILTVDLRAGQAPTVTVYVVTAGGRQVMTDANSQPMAGLSLPTSSAGSTPIWLNGNVVVLDPSAASLQSLPQGASLEMEIDYQVRDAVGLATGRIQAKVVVLGVNDAPIVVNGATTSFTMISGTPFNTSLAGAFIDGDLGNVLIFSAASLPVGLTLTSQGELGANFTAGTGLSASFVVTAQDQSGLSIGRTFTLNVQDKVPVAPVSLAQSTDLLQMSDLNWVALTDLPKLRFASEAGVQAKLYREGEDGTWVDVTNSAALMLTHGNGPDAFSKNYTLTPGAPLQPGRYAMSLIDAAGNGQSMLNSAQFDVLPVVQGTSATDDLIFLAGQYLYEAGNDYDVLNLPGVDADATIAVESGQQRGFTIGGADSYAVHDLGNGYAEVVDGSGNVALTHGLEALMLAGQTAIHLQPVSMALDESNVVVMGTPWMDSIDLSGYTVPGVEQVQWNAEISTLLLQDATKQLLDTIRVASELIPDNTYALLLTNSANDSMVLTSVEQVTLLDGAARIDFNPATGAISTTFIA